MYVGEIQIRSRSGCLAVLGVIVIGEEILVKLFFCERDRGDSLDT